MMPPVIHSLTEEIIEECVAIFIIAGVPKQNLRISVAVVVTSIHELQLTRQVQRILRDEKPVCRPFGTRGRVRSPLPGRHLSSVPTERSFRPPNAPTQDCRACSWGP